MYQVEAALVVKKFDEIAIEIWGAEIAKEIKALYIKDKILTVAVLSSAMSSELRFQENEIIKKLNQHFDKELVYKIRFLI